MISAPAQLSDRRAHWAFRFGAVVCAGLLAMQCIWLLLPELVRPRIEHLPTNATAASAVAKHYDDAIWAASLAVLRGDLWAETAFTQADLLWRNDEQADQRIANALQRARASLYRALRTAPHISGAWLMFAGLTLRFPSPAADGSELLKMSYYTGPSDQSLVPLRLETALRLESFNDIEMRQLIGRDIRLLVAQKQTTTIARIYNSASVTAKRFMEQTVRDIAPSTVDKLLNPGQK